MSDVEIEFPWVNYGAGDGEVKNKMLELTTQTWSPFNGCDNAQVFIFCMSYAFAKNKTSIPPPGSSGSMPPSAFKLEMRDLMRAVAIAKTGELKIIKKSGDYVKICEGYAYSAFEEVYNRIKNRDSEISPEMILDEMINEVESKRRNVSN